MTTVEACPLGSPSHARPLNTTIPLDSRLCWTQEHTCITDCCSTLNGTIQVSCGLDQCLGSFAQLDWRDCVKGWYISNDVDLDTKWYSCFPRSPSSTAYSGAGTTSPATVGLDTSSARARGPSWTSLLATLVVVAAAVLAG